MQVRATPIKTWIWVGAIFIVIQASAYVYFKKNYAKVYSTVKLSEQIQNTKRLFEENDEQDFNVLIIGSSLTGHGIGESQNNHIRLGKLWGSKDPIEQWVKNENLIEKVIQLKPDLVCLQSELAAVKLKFATVHPVQVITNTVSNFNNILLGSQLKLDTLLMTPYPRNLKKKTEVDYLINGLQKFRKQNIPIVLLHVPLPVKSEREIYTSEFSSQLKNILNHYNKKTDAIHWKYDGTPLYFNKYKDAGHLNIEGNAIYTNWLVNKIENEFVKQ